MCVSLALNFVSVNLGKVKMFFLKPLQFGRTQSLTLLPVELVRALRFANVGFVQDCLSHMVLISKAGSLVSPLDARCATKVLAFHLP